MIVVCEYCGKEYEVPFKFVGKLTDCIEALQSIQVQVSNGCKCEGGTK